MYDYRLDDAGITNFENDDEDEEKNVNMMMDAKAYRFYMQPRPSDAFLLFIQSFLSL